MNKDHSTVGGSREDLQAATCGCPACAVGVSHWSDCAVHNMPAMPNGPCDCGAMQAAAWRDIATAPHGWVLVAGKDRTGAGMMVVRRDGRGWESADDGYGAYINPTHWMPLPLPPSEADNASPTTK